MIRNVLTKCVGFVGRIAYAGCVLDVISNYVAEPTLCIGQSMKPTINLTSRNNIVLTEHLSNHLQSLKKNDIVIARSPQDPCVSICKRITGMEGDLIHTAEQKTIKVPKGHVWLTGDNCDNSVDSRTYGPVPCGLILGRVCYKVRQCTCKHIYRGARTCVFYCFVLNVLDRIQRGRVFKRLP